MTRRAGLTTPWWAVASTMSGAANLYPELLLALVGHAGEAFVQRDQGTIMLADAVDWVTPPERYAALRAPPALRAIFSEVISRVPGPLCCPNP